MAGKKPLSKDRAIALCWKKGLLSYKLREHQMPVYLALWDAINKKGQSKYVINCARRFGKSFISVLVAVEFAIRKKNAQIRFAAPTQKELIKIIRPIIAIIYEDAPEGLKPKWSKVDGAYRFPNGSELHIAGVNADHADDLRGTASHLNIVDEAGFVDDLNYLVKSVLTPQTLTTGGKTLLVSTPPKTPDHPYYEYARDAEQNGRYSKFTIYDNSSLDAEQIADAEREAGGRDSTDFRREYLCEWVVDENLQIIPEWNEGLIGEDSLEHPFCKFWHRYDAMDLGVKDLTAVLFAHYNFGDATLYIDDELDISGPKMTTDLLVRLIKQKEDSYRFGNPKVYRRISDNNNLQLLNDLTLMHDLPFSPVRKLASLEQMVNRLRLMVREGRIKINPRCEKLIGCLKYGIWNERHKDFDRSDKYGHYDHLAALIYLVLMLDTHTNPIPVTYGFNSQTMINRPEGFGNLSKNAQVIRLAFGGKRGRR